MVSKMKQKVLLEYLKQIDPTFKFTQIVIKQVSLVSKELKNLLNKLRIDKGIVKTVKVIDGYEKSIIPEITYIY